MSDPRFSDSDSRFSDTDPRSSDPRDYRHPGLIATGPVYDSANALWGWVAAAVFVAAVLLFVFASGNRDTASNSITMPPTASAPKLPPMSSDPSTTGAAPTTRTPAPAPTAPQNGNQ
jgi:hypothetical protein